MIKLLNLIKEAKNIKPFSTSENDAYEYKRENDKWYTKLKTSDDWLDMKQNLSKTNYEKAIDTLSKYSKDTLSKKDIVKTVEKPDTLKSKSIDSKEKSTNSNSVILMGGLDYRAGDYKIDQQKSILQTGLDGRDVIAHRYTDISGVIDSIKNNPDSSVVLFSAGCSYASKIAKVIKDTSKLYIVEPYAKSSNTVRSVQAAVDRGVPRSNVLTGNTVGRGAGIVTGATKTPNVRGGGMASHWNALKVVGKYI